jgi:hypothetical protein
VAETTTEPQPLSVSAPEIATQLARVRNRTGRVALETGIAMAVPALIAWLAVVMPLDWLIGLPRWARALFLLAGVGGSGSVLFWFGIRRWMHKPDNDRTALNIERALPEFRSRFIASVQLARQTENAPAALVRALLRETEALAQQVDFQRVVKTDKLRLWLKIGAAAFVFAVVLWFYGGRASWPLFQRACLVEVPLPRKTQIIGFSGDRVIAVGNDVRIEANAAGIVPVAGKLLLRTASGKKQEFTFDADPLNKAHFFRSLQSVQETFEYWLELGDNKTPVAHVSVRPRPTVLSLVCQQQWPAYTRLAPQYRSPGELKLLAGSKLYVRLKASAPLRSATLRLVGADKNIALKQFDLKSNAVQPPEWSGVAEIPAKDVSGMTFHLVDTEGVESKGMAVYRIEIVPDQPPTVRVLWPARREELVTSKATLLVVFEAKDDFGIGNVRLHYATNWIEGSPHKTITLDLGNEEPKSLTRRFEWKLERLIPPLVEGDVVDYWIEARDTNNVTGPGIAIIPEHYQARVVSEEQKRADLNNRLNDTLQGLNDVRQGQEELARRLGDLIQEKPQP